MTCGKKLTKGTGTLKNILDYTKIYYPKHAIIHNPEPGWILPEKYVVILDEYNTSYIYDIIFFTCNVTDKAIPILSDQFILEETINHFNIYNITGTIKEKILEFSQIEGIYNIVFKYMITGECIDILYNYNNPNPMTFLYEKRFQLGNNVINIQQNKTFIVKNINYNTNKKQLMYLINLQLERIFLQTGNPLVIDYYNILYKKIL